MLMGRAIQPDGPRAAVAHCHLHVTLAPPSSLQPPMPVTIGRYLIPSADHYSITPTYGELDFLLGVTAIKLKRGSWAPVQRRATGGIAVVTAVALYSCNSHK